jgi:hypothetical protein
LDQVDKKIRSRRMEPVLPPIAPSIHSPNGAHILLWESWVKELLFPKYPLPGRDTASILKERMACVKRNYEKNLINGNG